MKRIKKEGKSDGSLATVGIIAFLFALIIVYHESRWIKTGWACSRWREWP